MKLYACNTLPNHWVADDADGTVWLFPAQTDGWRERAPYRGHMAALREVGAHNALGTGWPGVQTQ